MHEIQKSFIRGEKANFISFFPFLIRNNFILLLSSETYWDTDVTSSLQKERKTKTPEQHCMAHIVTSEGLFYVSMRLLVNSINARSLNSLTENRQCQLTMSISDSRLSGLHGTSGFYNGKQCILWRCSPGVHSSPHPPCVISPLSSTLNGISLDRLTQIIPVV